MKHGVVFAALKALVDARLGICALALVLGLALIHGNAYLPEQRVVSFAKPQLGLLAYDVEVANLGSRISTAFGIQRLKAEEFSH